MFFQGGIPYQANINGLKAAVLKNGGFVVIDANPGPIQIEICAASIVQALSRNPTLQLKAAANDRIFVRATPVRGNTAVLNVLPESEAILELRFLRESK